MVDTLKMYIITHKDFSMPTISEGGYIPLLVGAIDKPKALTDKYLCDDNGENISCKNNSYCEMTGLYWIWKNTNDKYIGLVHYRRYFLNNAWRLKFQYDYYVKNIDSEEENHIITEKEIETLLKNNRLAVKKSKIYRKKTLKLFETFVGKECINETIDVLKKEQNFESYINYLNKHEFIECNMFIGEKELIDHWCEWIFEVLDNIDELHHQRTNEYYCNRELGYIAEMLFGAWIEVNGIDYIVLDVITPGKSNQSCISGFEKESNIYSLYSFFPNLVSKLVSKGRKLMLNSKS